MNSLEKGSIIALLADCRKELIELKEENKKLKFEIEELKSELRDLEEEQFLGEMLDSELKERNEDW
jgi:regulator of replication initiation timing